MTAAGPVTITRRDGSTEVRAPYSPEELREIRAAARRRCAGQTSSGTRCERLPGTDGYCQAHRPGG
jgi:hypothetical protein